MSFDYTYEEFEIIVSSGTEPGAFSVRIHTASVNNADGKLIIPSDLLERADPFDATGLAVKSRGAVKRQAESEVAGDVAEEVGRRLFQALKESMWEHFVDRRGAIGEREGIRIRLKFDLNDEKLRPLAGLPWETLYQEDEQFIGLDHRWPIVRSLDGTRLQSMEPRELPLKILFMMSNPGNTAQLDLETEKEALERWGSLPNVEIIKVEPNLAALEEALRERPQVFHYMGHGDVEGEGKGSKGVLILEDASASSEDLFYVFKNRGLRLVVLNACKTGVEGAGPSDPFSGVASALVRSGIPSVIAMQTEVSDYAANTFSRVFYERLVAGSPVDAAMSAARRAIKIDPKLRQHGTYEWATPVLLMHAMFDGVLFAADETMQDVEADGDGVGVAVSREPVVLHEEQDTSKLQVWLADDGGKITLNWNMPESSGPRDFVALYKGEPKDPRGFIGGAQQYVRAGGPHPTAIEVASGSDYYAVYISVGSDRRSTITAISAPMVIPS